MNRNVHLCVAAVLGMMVMPLASSAQAPPSVVYDVIDLGTLSGGTSSAAYDINNAGQVVGRSSVLDPAFPEFKVFRDHAFLWENGAIRDLGTLSTGNNSSASRINAAGQVVGISELSDPRFAPGVVIREHAVLYENGEIIDLGDLNDLGPFSSFIETSAAFDINDSSQVVGRSGLFIPEVGGTEHPFLWQKEAITDIGAMTDIGAPLGPPWAPAASVADARSINNVGQVVGWAAFYFGNGDITHATLWNNGGAITDLGGLVTVELQIDEICDKNDDCTPVFATAPGPSRANRINDIGQVVGWALSSSFTNHAFLWENGAMTDLGTLPGFGVESEALDINENGQVVGVSSAGGGVSHAFLRENDVMKDLNELIDPRSGWVLVTANAINNNGDIVGSGLHNGEPRGFLLRANDVDGDGLFDSWETSGIDVDGDGNIDLDLPAMGANPLRKDIFVEVDRMSPLSFKSAAADLVIDAFAAAPVSNPDGSTGITMHIDNGPSSLMNPLTGASWGGLSRGNAVPFISVLGTFDGSGGYNWEAFDAIKADHFPAERRAAFHYVILGDRYGSAAQSSSGISRDIVASDFLVTLGSAPVPGGTAFQQAGTLMHELGHNLGLRHGGASDINRQPNFLSIMSYAFQFTGLVHNGAVGHFDYSRFGSESLGRLDETALSELNGFGAAPSMLPFKTVYYCAAEGNWQLVDVVALIDWNCVNGFNPGTVVDDINNDGVLTTMDPFDDWSHLVYRGGLIGGLGAGAALPGVTPVIEPSLSEILETTRVLAPFDLYLDGHIDLRDFALFQECFASKAGGTGGRCLAADFDADGVVDVTDHGRLTNALTGP